MTITATLKRVTGPATSAGTALATQTIAAPAVWTRLTNIDGFIPTGGAKITMSSNAEAFHYAIMDPVSSRDAAAGDRVPRTNGVLVPCFGTGAEDDDVVPFGAQVWVKAA